MLEQNGAGTNFASVLRRACTIPPGECEQIAQPHRQARNGRIAAA